MKTIRKLLLDGIENYGSVNSPEFKSFGRKFKNAIQKELNPIGGKITAYSVGHYHVSGFFKIDNDNDKYYYFYLSNIIDFSNTKLLYRTVKNEKDYTGGDNQYVEIDSDMINNMVFR